MILIRQFLILAFTISLLTSCTAPTSNSNTTVVQTTPSPTPSPSAAATRETAYVQVTLPLLDALLTDEKFVGQLKQNLKLSEEQIDSLKRASSSEIARLRESN